MKEVRSGFTLIDALLLLGLEERTGELVVESGNNIGSLIFHQGRILLAFSPYTRAIGDLLVEKGALSDAELLDVLRQQRNGPHMPIGSLLLKAGKVTFGVLEAMVHDQIRMSIRDFLSWKDVLFHFTDKEVSPFDTISLPVYEFLPQNTIHAIALFAADLSKHRGVSPVQEIS